jgi:hypothetical protein
MGDYMSQDHVRSHGAATSTESPAQDDAAVGKTSRSSLLQRPANPVASGLLQLRADRAPEHDDDEMLAIAQDGISGAGGDLPYLDRIQASFGDEHDLGAIRAHVGGPAGIAASAIGAQAYATGNSIAFQHSPDLHTAAHEAAHIVQQRSGIALKGGTRDLYEQEADAVADLTVAGQSAAPLLAKYTRDGQKAEVLRSTGRVQLKGTIQAPQVTARQVLVADSEAFNHLKDGERAVDKLRSTSGLVTALYNIVIEQVGSKNLHDKLNAAYDVAKKDRENALAKSNFEKGLLAFVALVELGTSIHGLIAAAKVAQASAQGLRDSYAMYRKTQGVVGGGLAKEIAKEGGKAIIETGKAGRDTYEKGVALHEAGAAVDSETVLADHNHAAIAAGNDALDALSGKNIEFNLLTVEAGYGEGGLAVAHMAKGVQLLTKEAKALPDGALQEMKRLNAECDDLQNQIAPLLSKIHAVWKAYMSGAAEALSDQRHRQLFETIQGWKRIGDPRISSLKVSMDQSIKGVHFRGTGVASGEALGEKAAGVTYRTHRYEEGLQQLDEGVLHVSDPHVARALQFALDPNLWLFSQVAGMAESAVDGVGEKSQKYPLSISLCKALMSVGVSTWVVDAQVRFYDQDILGGLVVNRHKGDWYQKWHLTSEFNAFWNGHLGRQWAYVQHENNNKQLLPGATREEIERSRQVPNIYSQRRA